MFFDRGTLGTPVNLLESSQKCQGIPFSLICQNSLLLQRPHLTPFVLNQGALNSAKVGAVETGCRDLYDVIYYLIIQNYPHPLHPPPTAPPCNEYPFDPICSQPNPKPYIYIYIYMYIYTYI